MLYVANIRNYTACVNIRIQFYKCSFSIDLNSTIWVYAIIFPCSYENLDLNWATLALTC